MEPESPPQTAAEAGCNLRGHLFLIAGNGTLDSLSEMEGVMGDGAVIWGEEPPSPATSQPGDLLLAFVHKGKVHMAYISKVELGGGSDEEEGSSTTSKDKSDDEQSDRSLTYDSSTTSSDAKHESNEEEEEQSGRSLTYDSSTTSADAKHESDEEEEEQSDRSFTYDSGSNSVTEVDEKEGSDTKKEAKENSRHLHIRVWQEYCVLVYFEGERWKLTKQQPIHWLQEDQVKEIHDRIRIENGGNKVNMTRNSDFLSIEANVYGWICRSIGTGATCKVYHADTEYAIKKMVLGKKFDDKGALQNKEPREITILSSFRQSAVVSFFQAWAADGMYKSYLKGSSSSSEGSSSSSEGDDADLELDDDLENERVPRYVAMQMEYCVRTLRNFLDDKDGEIDVEEAWFLLKEITKAIQSIHRRGVIHRDLKPGNIFFGDADGNTIKLGDFGHGCWAKQYAADERGTPNRGTKGYCAPELDGKDGEKPTSPTEKADIYSLGIILVDLFYLFGSGYRRVDVLKKLRTG